MRLLFPRKLILSALLFLSLLYVMAMSVLDICESCKKFWTTWKTLLKPAATQEGQPLSHAQNPLESLDACGRDHECGSNGNVREHVQSGERR